MIFQETKLKGAFIIDINRVEDERGFFGRSWCKREFEKQGLNASPVQANVSYNRRKGTLRGMHFQSSPYAETKTIRCTAGAIYDVIVDLRPDSETYKQWIGVELTKESFRSLYIPEGFAHGFLTLSNHTSVHYMVSQYYTPEAESGVRFDDPAFKIAWPSKPTIISQKDLNHKAFVEEVINTNLN